ncbi:hypothetical protein ACOMHN_045047 [Nucella lapillus]
MSACATVLVVMATILGPITLVFMSVSFGTDHWLKFDVDRNKLTTAVKTSTTYERFSHSRYRGLFRECYPGNDTAFLDDNPNLLDDFCLPFEYELPTGKSDEFFTRIHLLRLFLGFFIMALVFYATAFVFGLVLCCWRTSRWGYIAGILAYIAAFSQAAAIAFFHGAEYLERNKISDDGFYMQWPEVIQNSTTRSYGWSYTFGWVSMVLATLAATFYSIAGCYIASSRYEDRDSLDKEPYRGGREYPLAMEQRYPMDDPYVIKPQPMYAADYPHAYAGPYLMAAPENPRYLVAAEPPPREMWNIREMAS